jgi:flavoprotein
MSELSEEQQQREDVRQLLRDAIFSVDAWVGDHYDELLLEVTPADRTSLVVEAALASLVGNGVIRKAPDAEIPVWLPIDIQDHLMPDIEAAKDRYRRFRQAVKR